MELALYIWTLIYQPPKDEFKPPIQIIEVIDIPDAPPVEIPKVQPKPTVTPQLISADKPLTQEEYQQVRPEPTGCHLGDSVPMEACTEK